MCVTVLNNFLPGTEDKGAVIMKHYTEKQDEIPLTKYKTFP